MPAPRPVVALVGAPAAWMPSAAAALTEAGYAVTQLDDPAPPVERLAELAPALLLVDGSGASWAAWVARVKTEQATRRVPALVVAPDPAAYDAALAAGADGALSPDEVAARIVAAAADLARAPDEATHARLASQCAEPLPPRAREAVERFNAGEFYAQHDLFEAQWMDEPGPVRDLYRAILQVGVAYYHVTRGNPRGARKMLLRSLQWLAALPDVCQGVDVARLRQDAARVRAALEDAGPDDLAKFDRALLRPICLVTDPLRPDGPPPA